MDLEKTFLGTGWSFPPNFDRKLKSVELVSDQIDINQSLEILLSTRLGERIMLPKYGCDLNELVFESMNTTFETYITDLVKSAILYHEPRIDMESLEFENDQNEGKLLIIINYKIRITNSRSNFVFPFYKNEKSI
ncbi:MAG: GPW/gp25 family protein [Saprospiraceae bacterium]